jgi:uncharacterized protein (TIGR03437 family)
MLVAFNNDGQSSLFVHGDASPTVSYADAPDPSVSVSDLQIPAGAEMAIEITGSGVNFRQWTPSLGLGTSDVAVRKVWATGEGKALAWLTARADAAQAVTPLVATVGMATLRLPASLTVLPANSRPFVRMSELEGQYLYPGAAAVIPVGGLPAGTTVGAVTASIGGASAAVLNVSGSTVTVQIPSGLTPGAYLLQLTFAGAEAMPAALEVRPAPPVIFFAQKQDGAPVTSSAPARPAETVLLTVGSLIQQEPMLGSVRVFSGEVEHQVTAVRVNPDLPGTYIVEVRLTQAEPSGGTLTLTVVQGEARSVIPFLLPYQP